MSPYTHSLIFESSPLPTFCLNRKIGEAGRASPVGPMQDVPVQEMMGLEEGKHYRLELMKERTTFHDTVESNKLTLLDVPFPNSRGQLICLQTFK